MLKVVEERPKIVKEDIQMCEIKDKSRKINLDLLRIIACFFVIVNHTNSRIFLSTEPSIKWLVSIIYFYSSKIAVPIFIMISGAVLLGKQETYKQVFKKRILKTITVIILFSLVYYINGVIKGPQRFSIIEFFKSIIENAITNAYWYLYMYLGLMIMLPLLRKMVKNMESKDYLFLFGIYIIFNGILPILVHYLSIPNITGSFSLPIMTVYVVYFIIGYFIQNKLDKKFFNPRVLAISIIASIFCLVMSVYLTYYEYAQHSDTLLFMDNIAFITVCIPSVSIFYICKYAFLKRENNKKGKIITNIAICTFGIYLLSDLLIEKFEFIYQFLIKYHNEMFAIIILEFVVFIVSYAITWLLRKVPLLKKII